MNIFEALNNYVSKLNEEWSDDVSIADKQYSRHFMHKSPNMRANASGVLYGPDDMNRGGDSYLKDKVKLPDDVIKNNTEIQNKVSADEQKFLDNARERWERAPKKEPPLEPISDEDAKQLVIEWAKMEAEDSGLFGFSNWIAPSAKVQVPGHFKIMANEEGIYDNLEELWKLYQESVQKYRGDTPTTWRSRKY